MDLHIDTEMCNEINKTVFIYTRYGSTVNCENCVGFIIIGILSIEATAPRYAGKLHGTVIVYNSTTSPP